MKDVTDGRSELFEFLDPIVKHAERTHDEERSEIILLSKIGIKCDRLQCLWAKIKAWSYAARNETEYLSQTHFISF